LRPKAALGHPHNFIEFANSKVFTGISLNQNNILGRLGMLLRQFDTFVDCRRSRIVIEEAIFMVTANAQPTQNANDSLKSVATAMATAAEAVRDGASDALAKAKQAMPASGAFVSKFVYSSCYYLSYGVVFPSLLVTNFLPGCGPMANGLVDGAAAAKDVLVEMKDKAAARKAAKAECQVVPVVA
jgi:hypothetical protein